MKKIETVTVEEEITYCDYCQLQINHMRPGLIVGEYDFHKECTLRAAVELLKNREKK